MAKFCPRSCWMPPNANAFTWYIIHMAIGRSENPKGASCNVVDIICIKWNRVKWSVKLGGSCPPAPRVSTVLTYTSKNILVTKPNYNEWINGHSKKVRSCFWPSQNILTLVKGKNGVKFKFTTKVRRSESPKVHTCCEIKYLGIWIS